MANKQLNNYIQKARQSGLSDEQIENELIKTGWKNSQIQLALQPSTGSSSATNKSQVLKIAIIVLVMLIIGSAAFTGYYYYSNSGNKEPVPLDSAGGDLVVKDDVEGKNFRILSTIPKGATVISEHYEFNQHGTKVAYIIEQGGKQHAVINNQVGPAFDEVLGVKGGGGLAFVPLFAWAEDGERIFYSGVERKDGDDFEFVSVLNDTILDFDGTLLLPDFSPNGRDVIFYGGVDTPERRQVYVTYIDGKFLEYSASLPDEIAFSDDGSHYAFETCNEGGDCSIVLDGKVLTPKLDIIDHIRFTDDENLLIYTGRTDLETDITQAHLYHGTDSSPAVTAKGIWLPHGHNQVGSYMAWDPITPEPLEGEYVFVKGEPAVLKETVRQSPWPETSTYFSGSGRYAYITPVGTSLYVNVDGTQYGPYTEVSNASKDEFDLSYYEQPALKFDSGGDYLYFSATMGTGNFKQYRVGRDLQLSEVAGNIADIDFDEVFEEGIQHQRISIPLTVPIKVSELQPTLYYVPPSDNDNAFLTMQSDITKGLSGVVPLYPHQLMLDRDSGIASAAGLSGSDLIWIADTEFRGEIVTNNP